MHQIWYVTLKIYRWLQGILSGSQFKSSLKFPENIWKFSLPGRKNQNYSGGPQNQGFWKFCGNWKVPVKNTPYNNFFAVYTYVYCILSSPKAATFNGDVSGEWFSQCHASHMKHQPATSSKWHAFSKKHLQKMTEQASKTTFCLEYMDKIIHTTSFWWGKKKESF